MTRSKRISQEKTVNTGPFSGTWVTQYEMEAARAGDWVYEFNPPIPYTITHEKSWYSASISPTGIQTDRSIDKYEIKATLPNGKEFCVKHHNEYKLVEWLGLALTRDANTAFRYNKPHMLTGRAARRSYKAEQ